MNRRFAALLAAALFIAASAEPVRAACDETKGGLGVSRIVEIDTSGGPLYGDMSRLVKEESFLGPKEIVLTFDDGPMPRITRSILQTLERFCTKATFFSVGRMALAYPDVVKEVLAAGHTLGTHTWSHPLNLKRLDLARAKDQIDRGFAAVALAAGQPIAPFFRFPGLNDSDPLLAHLQATGVAAFTVDVVSNDSFIGSADRLISRVVAHTEARNGGILLFHDIKASTAKALPTILSELHKRGFKVVHMRPKAPMATPAGYEAELSPKLAKSPAARETHQLVPFTGVPAALASAEADEPGLSVTSLAPEPRERVAQPSAAPEGPTDEAEAAKRSNRSKTRRNKGSSRKKRSLEEASLLGW